MFIRQFKFTWTILFALALVGAGCGKKDTSPPILADAGSEIPDGWKGYSGKMGRYEAAYPEDWQVREYPEDPLIVDFIAPDNPAAPGFEPIGDISVVVRENPEGLTTEQFYDGQRQANLFADAQGGVREREVDGIPSRVFIGVIGKITADVAVVPLSAAFLEVEFTRSDLDPTTFEQFLDYLQVRR